MNCPFCKKYINLDQPLRRYYDKITNQEYTLYKCNSCLGLFWFPLKIIPEFYENEFFEGYIIWHSGLRQNLPAHNRMFFKEFKSLDSKGKKLLDVGCAEGLFLKEAAKLGFEVYGIDFDKKSVEIAKNVYGLKNVYTMSIEEFYEYANKNNLKFDIISFFEVLEHQDNPRQFLSLVNNLLEKDGYVIGSVPNSGGLIKSLGGYPPHHFLWFNKNNLEKIFDLFGFEKIKILYVKENLLELSSRTQAILTGRIGLYFRNLIIRKLLGSKGASKENYENKVNINIRNKVFKVIKKIRDYIFVPFILIMYPIVSKGGLYFEFKKKS
jgi:2-polyprenyl-3-methyl-5-hydroxy-6-metoxy-1,4-benzoquinol methylase